MTRAVGRWPVGVAAVVLLCVPLGVWGQEEWTWTDGKGKVRTRAELKRILDQSKRWYDSGFARGKPVDLSGAHLVGATMGSANLMRANLKGASLQNANLSSAILGQANLNRAHLDNAKLGGAHLENADLGSAHLDHANLGGAYLDYADLSGAHLMGADLRHTRLIGVNLGHTDLTEEDLSGANLTGANLRGAHLTAVNLTDVELKDANFADADPWHTKYEPKSHPEIRGMAAARNLEFLTYGENPNALADLRKEFRDGGFRTQERKITYALNRRQAERDGLVERWFKKVAFDWTCQYGMNPWRPLEIWLGLLLICLLFYAVFIHMPGKSGIYRVRKPGRGEQGESVEERIRPGRIPSHPWWRYPLRWAGRELSVLFSAGFFSLMSAFNIGFRDINFGRWLRLLTREEYDLKARGWARTVAACSRSSACI